MDLEARLRALREDKRRSASSTSSNVNSKTVQSFSWPEVPSSLVKKEIPSRQPVPIVARDDMSPVRHSSVLCSAAPPITIINNCSSEEAETVTPSKAQPESSKRALEQEEVLQVTVTQLLGPDYIKAVNVAQYAIEKERRQMPHTAIDAYILAGQMLIEIGRRQATTHLQDIVKAKALALLERAEKLSEWTNKVLTKDSSQQALAVAYQESQQNRNKLLTEKQELVFKMQQDNRNMKERLNQLVLLTKIRGRMIKAVSTRRARKAAEAAAQDLDGSDNEFKNLEIVKNRHGKVNDVTGFSSEEEDELTKGYQHYQTDIVTTAGSSPRETQKVELINELHERIGLPQIDHLRKFEPLTNDLIADKKHEQLRHELKAAKQEADKLRAAVHKMEQCLQLAAQHSKQRSIKLEQQKALELAEVQSELERVQKELENERQLFGSRRSGSSSQTSSVVSDPGVEEMKDSGLIGHLRSSLHKAFRGRDEDSGGVDDQRVSIQRSSYSQNSPRRSPKSKEQLMAESYDVDQEMERDNDGGIWL